MAKTYNEQDLEASLRRAFVDRKFESILVDAWELRNEFLKEGLSFGINKGWLKTENIIEESQYTAITYVLTDKGKEYFGLVSKTN
ncbi:MAG: hypothetical protein Q8P57_04300 [Candidatus Pacearchaeota archaeon]|nr:hypothetical protein [Candidatus Pacearchaeota archaeon]